MSEILIYSLSLIVFGLTAGYAGYWIWNISPENLPKREKLPRNSSFATIILVIANLLWCIPHAKPLLPATLHFYLLPTVALCAFLAYRYLDYLFARALGGFFILLAYYFLHQSFTLHTPAAPLFSVFCFCLGIAGIFLSGKPHLLRDFIRLAARERWFRQLKAVQAVAFGGFCLILGLIQLLGRV